MYTVVEYLYFITLPLMKVYAMIHFSIVILPYCATCHMQMQSRSEWQMVSVLISSCFVHFVQALHGKQCRHPFTDRLLPIITDSMVDMELGTGDSNTTYRLRPSPRTQSHQILKSKASKLVYSQENMSTFKTLFCPALDMPSERWCSYIISAAPVDRFPAHVL